MRRLTTIKSYQNYIITADHGFLYTRDPLENYNKIDVKELAGDTILSGKRYLLTHKAYSLSETVTLPALALSGTPSVTMPIHAGVFNMPGSGLNYTHGGASLQEMLIPVLRVRTKRGAQPTENATLTLISGRNRITNLITYLEFLQPQPVSDIVKPTVYKVWFEDEASEKLSGEVMIHASSSEQQAEMRIMKVRFTLKNRRYFKNKKYYLVLQDDGSNVRIEPHRERHEFVIDIAFADDFGFNT